MVSAGVWEELEVHVIAESELRGMHARAAAASGERWRLDHRDGIPVVVIESDGHPPSVLRVMRDGAPSATADVAFIAHARDDLARLVAALERKADLSNEVHAEITARSAAASPGPWTPFLTADGGIGGENVMWMSDDDDQPDLYLFLDSHPASTGDYEFIAHARDDIPRLLSELAPG
jgi:hypothetical protein